MSNFNLVRPSYRQKMTAGIYAKLMSHLLQGASVADLVEETGLRPETVRKYVNALWNHRVVRICAWEANSVGRRVVAVYKIGQKENVPQPKMSRAERQTRYREKKRREKQLLLQQVWKEAA